MAQILITNYTGTVNADIVVCEAVSPAPYTLGTCYNLGQQIGPNTPLPQFFALPSNFDYDQHCFVYLSASTTLTSIPQLVTCGFEPPDTWGFEKCPVPSDKNIYVFYDTSGLYTDGVSSFDALYTTLSAASQSIRDWYYDACINNGYTGKLYEIPMPNKRYMSWASYPYLRYTTGGTLSDSSTVRIEAGPIGSPLLASMSPLSPFGDTVQLNQSPIIKRIATALDLATGNPLTGVGRSSGVPFNHSDYSNNTNGILVSGTTASADTNYFAVIVTTDASGGGGPYDCSPYSATSGGTNYYLQPYFQQEQIIGQRFSSITNTFSFSNPSPTIVIPNNCPPYGGYSSGAYSGSSLQRDYESWLKVWEDVNVNLNGFANVYMLPVLAKNAVGAGTQDIGYGTIYQALEIIEGEIPQAPSYFQSNYCDGPFSYSNATWPFPNSNLNQYSGWTYNQTQYFDFSPLSYYNSFTGFTATTAYQSLSPTNQLGPGLKNFGWYIDVTIPDFSPTSVSNSLDAFISLINQGDEIYTTTEPLNLVEGQAVTLEDFEGCWTYTGFRIDGQPSYNTLSPTNIYTDCQTCYESINDYVVRFAYNGHPNTMKGAFVSSSNTQNIIVIYGAPNESVDVVMSWPFPIGTGMNTATLSLNYNGSWINYTRGVTTGFTVTLDNTGEANINYKMIAASAPDGAVELMKFTITASTSPIVDTLYMQYMQTNSSTPMTPVDYTLVNLMRSPEPLTNYISVVGIGSVTANTSGDACSNYSVAQSYIISTGGVIGNTDTWGDASLFIGMTLTDKFGTPVNGQGRWIAVSNTYYTVYGQQNVTIALSIDITGEILDAAFC